MSNLQINFRLKFAFRKADQQTGGKWLIRGTKHHIDNQLQSLKHPLIYGDNQHQTSAL